jgi:S1-C subfamily serine protease
MTSRQLISSACGWMLCQVALLCFAGAAGLEELTFYCQQDTAEAADEAGRTETRKPNPATPDGLEFIDDNAIRLAAEAQVNRLMKAGESTSCRELAKQVDRATCRVELADPARQSIASQKLYVEGCQSIVAILVSRKHNDHWHIVPAATGFFVAPGVIATNRHVFEEKDESMFAMTSDTRVHAINEVLAANQDNDVALCRIDSTEYRPLALRTDIPVGAPVRVISHPRGRFYTLSQGLVSRRYLRPPSRPTKGDEQEAKSKKVRHTTTKWITITADFGVGSSGAPVFDRFGNVIAVSTSTQIVGVGEEDDRLSQMVFRDCVPAEVVRGLIE